MTEPAPFWDVYESDLAASQIAYDAKPYRVSLYANFKDDHPELWDGVPCDCQTGPGNWASYGFSGEGLRPEFDPCGASPALPEPDAETEADMEMEIEL